ncbi:MAG TPA: hypothetical protein VFE92_01220 [Dermatophilaceae bacterium]|nr:hypothetical protein [Dermatophilaceae bacterium]
MSVNVSPSRCSAPPPVKRLTIPVAEKAKPRRIQIAGTGLGKAIK